jgi:hypothetical protein
MEDASTKLWKSLLVVDVILFTIGAILLLVTCIVVAVKPVQIEYQGGIYFQYLQYMNHVLDSNIPTVF